MASFGPYKIEKQYTEEDIMTVDDFDDIEEDIYRIEEKLIELGYSIDGYVKNYWQTNSFLFYTYLNNIEEGIQSIGKAYFRPYGWQDKKVWTGGMGFSYRDVNRWINNINLIVDRLDNESSTLFPSDTLYPSETLLPH